MIFLNHHLTGDCYFVAARWLGVAPVAQVRSASPDSISLALSDGNQHLQHAFHNLMPELNIVSSNGM